jgi:phytoene dehydrogenase-like protein
LYERPEISTREMLSQEGFSDRIIDSFFRPFLGGVFLDPELETSSRMFEFVFRMFASGDAALPSEGIEAIPRQLAEALPEGTIRTGAEVEFVSARRIRLAGGDEIEAAAVVLATDAPVLARLVGDPPPPPARGVTCLYFAAPEPPWEDPILMLNGEARGPVNNLAVLSQAAPRYAPSGQSLISATVLGIPRAADASLEAEVRDQLRDWFGTQVDRWRWLRTYRIAYALPDQRPPALSPVRKPARRDDGLFVCGDHRNTASLQGAMVSGRRAAQAVIEQLG